MALKPGMQHLKQRLASAGGRDSVPLLTGNQIRNLKPLLVVRTAQAWRNSVLIWTAAFFLCFFGLHVFWRYTQFAGDNLILPTIELLCGAGLILMISLRDPLRDTLMFRDFAQGILGGAILMAAMSLPDYARQFRRYTYVFIAGTILLGIALATFGTGPGGSDAKVNLFFFQPVEVMRILIVFFLAGYFAQNWDVLRDLRHKTGPLAAHFHVPRLDYVLPVAVSVVVAVLVFVGDQGQRTGADHRRALPDSLRGRPKTVSGCRGRLPPHRRRVLGRTPRALPDHRGAARRYVVLALAQRRARRRSDRACGMGAFVGRTQGLWPGQWHPFSFARRTHRPDSRRRRRRVRLHRLRSHRRPLRSAGVAQRARGAECTRQLFVLPGHWPQPDRCAATDPDRRRNPRPHSTLGRRLSVPQFRTHIHGGELRRLRDYPLRHQSRGAPRGEGANARNFAVPTYAVAGVLAVCAVAILARAAYFQIARADEFLIKDAEVRFADKSIGLEYNPRLREALRHVARGDVTDRNGLPLATSSWDSLEKHREQYKQLGVSIDNPQSASRAEKRHYPLGPEFFYLVGDERTTLRRGARATAFQEKQSRVRLQGFDDRRELIELTDPVNGETSRVYRYDYADLIPLVRHRHDPDSEEVKSFEERQRDVKMSIDAAFEMKVSAILRKHLAAKGQKGAVVVLDPATGDLLAAVSYPWPGSRNSPPSAPTRTVPWKPNSRTARALDSILRDRHSKS